MERHKAIKEKTRVQRTETAANMVNEKNGNSRNDDWKGEKVWNANLVGHLVTKTEI